MGWTRMTSQGHIFTFFSLKSIVGKEILLKKYLEYYDNYIDTKTGEVVDFSGKTIYIQTQEERDKAKEYFKDIKAKQEEIKIINQQYEEYGNFIWSVYGMNELLFPELKPSTITRLIYLSTFLNYDGQLMKNSKNIMTKESLFNVLNLSRKETDRFYNEVIKNNILICENDGLFLNTDIFGKGKLTDSKVGVMAEKNKYITRLYINGVRELYSKSTPRSHKTLSYLFQVLPYVNREYNIVSHNPLETNLKEIKSMSLGEFCETIGYEKSNSTRLFKILFEPQFDVGGGEIKTAMRYVVDKGLSKETYSMFINPRVFYAGNKWKEVEILGKF